MPITNRLPSGVRHGQSATTTSPCGASSPSSPPTPGTSVIAETDSAADAVDMVLRFGAEVLVLDLALPWGTGMRVVRDLREAGSPCQIVVFTSYAADSPEVREAGRSRRSSRSPTSRGSSTCCANWPTVESPTPRWGRSGASRCRPAPTCRSWARRRVSGIEPNRHLRRRRRRDGPGDDAALVIHVTGVEQAPGVVARVAELDHILAVARCLRAVLRVQDRLALAEPDAEERITELHAVIVGGGRVGDRVGLPAPREGPCRAAAPGHRQRGLGRDRARPGRGGPVLARADDAARRSVGRPEGDRLWAG